MRRGRQRRYLALLSPYLSLASRHETELEGDVLGTLGLELMSKPAVQQTRTRLKHLKAPSFLSKATPRAERAKTSIGRLAKCLGHEDASDCILLAHPCIRSFQQMTHYSGGSLGELSCPVLLPSEMSAAQTLAIAEHALGAETYFEWGAGASTELLAPLAARSYTAEHYGPWCNCLRTRPIARCLDHELLANATRRRRRLDESRRITCVETKLNLRSFGRLQQNGINNTHRNIADAHRSYVSAIDETREVTFDVILVDGRAHFSCALKALGYTIPGSVVFVNDYPRKYGKRLLRYYDLVRTIGWNGDACDSNQHGRCLAQLRPKSDFFGNHQVHSDFLNQNKNFVRSPVNF